MIVNHDTADPTRISTKRGRVIDHIRNELKERPKNISLNRKEIEELVAWADHVENEGNELWHQTHPESMGRG